MTTDQKFFQDIVQLNSVAFEKIDKTIGDLNKNIGLIAYFYEDSTRIVGNTITENYDLASIFGTYSGQVSSSDTDTLLQSLQNSTSGVFNTESVPTYNVSSHVSTSMDTYNSSMSSSFLSGQIFLISSAVGVNSVISISSSQIDFSGNLLNSYIFDVPIDLAVYGINSFNGVSYSGSNLIQFDYSWAYSSSTDLLIKLAFQTSQTNQYLAFYWGNTDSNFISTNYSVDGPTKYVGTYGFINNIGVNTISVYAKNVSNFSSRKNFWSNAVPYNVGFSSVSYVDSTSYLWAVDRINETVYDGIPMDTTPPIRYPITGSGVLNSYLTSSSQYAFVYNDFYTKGLKYDSNANANIVLTNVFNSNNFQDVDFNNISYSEKDDVPLSYAYFSKNPKKKNLLSGSGFSLIDYQQQLPSAFIKPLNNTSIWRYFASNIIKGKGYSRHLSQILTESVSTVDNFVADFLFGTSNNNIEVYFTGTNRIISKNTLKAFTQPFGSNDITPLNFSEYQEKSIYKSTNIVSSKEYLTFSSGLLNMKNDYDLPESQPFEIFKPISFVCNGIDPYNQGTGLAFDYTLNLSFKYSNQNKFKKTIKLMSSKFVISESDYNYKINNNQDVYGYYYLTDPNANDFSSYSALSINDYRLYGYAGVIPDLKDGVERPILSKVFSPEDSTKYTYEQYIQFLNSQGITSQDDINDAIQAFLDAGNTFAVVDLNIHSNAFVSLEEASICATNYALGTPKYWNDDFPDASSLLRSSSKVDQIGFTQLISQINSGGVVTSLATGPVNFTISNVPVGYNCVIQDVTVNTLGLYQTPGRYTSWILPPQNMVTDEQPGQIQYDITDQGLINPSSIKILNRGAGFYFDFNTYLTDVGLSTGIGSTNASIYVSMNNLARFQATVTNNHLVAFTQTAPPANGYIYSFPLNQKCFYGLGYTSTANVDIQINNTPTVDSFFIAQSGLNAGALEYFGTFSSPQSNISSLNYTSGTQYLSLFDNEIFNTISVPYSYSGNYMNFLSIDCKLIELNNRQPSGYIDSCIYAVDGSEKILVATSDKIYYTDISKDSYQTLQFPFDFSFNEFRQTNSSIKYWVSIRQNLNNSILSIKGGYYGLTTSSFSVSTSQAFNSQNQIVICGSISTSLSAYDLDLGKATIGISSIFLNNITQSGINTIILNIRKDISYNSTENSVSLRLSTTYNSQTNLIFSEPISISSIGTSYTGVAFTFATQLSALTQVNSTEIITSRPLGEGKLYISRALDQYDVTQVGLATSSQIGLTNTSVNFNFVFNKIFGQVSGEKFGSFNNTDFSQFGLAGPNRNREIPGVNEVDGYWSYIGKKINKPISIYPRALIASNSTIGTSSLSYNYIGYSHDMFVNVGYNSSGVYGQDLIALLGYPKWKATWMDRSSSNFKNFSVFNVISQTYIENINYRAGLSSNTIGITTSPKVAIFEGTFKPGGDLSQTVPVVIGLGTSSGVQVYINNSTQPLIDTFSVVSAGSTSVTGILSTTIRANAVQFRILYFTLGTASITATWNAIGVSSSISAQNSLAVSVGATTLNSGFPVDEIVFLNVSKTQSDATSVNSGYPPGDSFIIRSS